MNSQRIAVITDTGTDVPEDFIAEHDIRLVPLRINFSDGSTYESGITITPAELIERLPTEIPTTSLPSPMAINDAFQRAKRDGYTSAVFVSISSGLSATCETARMVARQQEDFPVLVVDTLNIGPSAGLVVMEAVREIESGVPFSHLETTLHAAVRKTKVFFAVPTLEYLYKGGRINEAVYRIGSALNIKPVITCDEKGHYVIAKKARGWKRALDAEIALAAEESRKYPHMRIAICCSVSCQMFEELEARIREKIDNIDEIIYADISADLLVHTGPDLVGICTMGM